VAEIERLRVRDRETEPERIYDRMLRFYEERVKRNETGPVVIRKRDRDVELSRQGRIRYYLNHQVYKETPLQQWIVFTHELRTQSGKHRHQGGLVIYVIEGKGYSIVEGERWDWEKGDLVLLPMKPGGVEHQHFNLDPERPSTWIAFIHTPIMEHLAHEMTQMEDSPEYRRR
jgi:quercetin dioxygenase-like cupin family protein